jgi:ATP-dependent DNA helicase RecG
VLVATTVIEVGVDVPNATVMVVEHAERFGLSQLHQLRGRVGRGAARSWCVLMVGDPQHGTEARERLRIMERTTDGFRIAQYDLELRGPGAMFGTQQHGLSDLQFLGEILRAPDLIDRAREEARAVVVRDRGRTALAILGRLGGRWQRRLALAEVG